MSSQNYQHYEHWNRHTDSQNICWLTLDRKGESVNSMNREVFNELDKILDDIKQKNPAGVIIASAKKSGFIAGADIKQFTNLKTVDEAFDLIRHSQLVLDKLEALPMPTVAMINGHCLGGGCELALACKYRVALEDPKTIIGLPEVKLGIHPGWGGTVRLPKLVGAIEAMKIMLPGHAVNGKKAQKIGLVDACVPLRELERAAEYFVIHQPKPKQPTRFAKLSNHELVRPWLAKIFYRNLKAEHVIREHYPAPYMIVDLWLRNGIKNSAYEKEARSIAELMTNATSRNLVRVFFLQERMKSLAKAVKFNPSHVHVIGAGTMGGDIAAWCALKGMHVTLQDMSPEKIAPAMKRAHKLFNKKLKESHLVQAAWDRLQPDVKGLGATRADVIIEAAFEDLKVKQDIFKNIESKAKKSAILATNTSSIPLADIAKHLQNPERLVGIHFFNPVAKMLLVEVVMHDGVDDTVVDQACAFVGKISKLPLPVASKPGFLVNRILMPYLMEAMTLLDEGTPAEFIDRAAVKFGMPMGPVTLADKVGLDICLSVAQVLTQHYGGKISDSLKQKVEAGKLGVKTGEGFYQYDAKGRKITGEKFAEAAKPKDISDRLVLRMVNEAVACLHEKIIEDVELLDAGMIFGTGFAPFHGGPMQYAKTCGFDHVYARLEQLEKQYGERFKPCAGWSAMVVDRTQSAADVSKKDNSAQRNNQSVASVAGDRAK